MQLYYIAGLLQYAAQWCTTETNREQRLLAGRVDSVDLPKYLMQGAKGPKDSPHIVQQVASAWNAAVKYVIRKAPYA